MSHPEFTRRSDDPGLTDQDWNVIATIAAGLTTTFIFGCGWWVGKRVRQRT